jgi:hypothetical protein
MILCKVRNEYSEVCVRRTGAIKRIEARHDIFVFLLSIQNASSSR